ncbi:helix-turn-helix domain-containing protein [Corynebacterium sp. Marseille-P4321]|uniref:helix-turn-helix domain-containing protein n=1 Tax=Corynebacterium sp. Marseille-P4321 TaxID=2736603 RepID=UPI00158C57AA|nr:helix-turn-helix transcriptional regulator [Corynebacterium sp. Marseille-P4321]
MKPEDYLARNSADLNLDAFLGDPEIQVAFEDAEARSEFVAYLRKIRSDSGITQSRVAQIMGTTQSAISDFENGDTDPQLSTVQRYARAIGVEIKVVVDSPAKD